MKRAAEKYQKPSTQAAMASPGEWPDTAYVPVMNAVTVKIKAVMVEDNAQTIASGLDK